MQYLNGHSIRFHNILQPHGRQKKSGQNNSYIALLLSVALIFLAAGCTQFRALRVMNASQPIMTGAVDSIVLFSETNAHVIIIPVRINNSEKIYHFMLDTAALTLVSRRAANDLGLPSGVEITIHDTVNGQKKIDLVNLASLRVGGFEVSDCGAGIIEMDADENRLGMLKIDGVLGSNFLKYFKVTIDYKSKTLHLSKDTRETPSADGAFKTAFKTKMEMGYAPVVRCRVDDSIDVNGIIDTGVPYIATLPLALAEKTVSYQNGRVVKARGAIWEAAFKASGDGYLLRLETLTFGPLKLKQIPVVTLPYRHILIGYKFLSHFIVTLNYPAGIMTLKPYDGLDFDSNIYSFGAVVRKKEDGKVIVTALWEGASAEKAGIRIGDEIVSVDGKNVKALSPMEIMNIYTDDAIKSINVVVENKEGTRAVRVDKEWLLPPLR